MKKETWLPAAVALGIGAAIVLATFFLQSPKNVYSHFLGILASTLGFMFLAYLFHFIGQQDFIGGGCRPSILSPLGAAVMLAMFVQLMMSVISFVLFAAELFGGVAIPVGAWLVIIGGHAAFYVILLYASRLKPKEDETIFVNGKALKQRETFFVWPWLIEEYRLCRHWPEHPAPIDSSHQA